MDEVLEFLDKAEAAGQNVMSVIGSQVRATTHDIKTEHTTAAVDLFLIIIIIVITIVITIIIVVIIIIVIIIVVIIILVIIVIIIVIIVIILIDIIIVVIIIILKPTTFSLVVHPLVPKLI